MAINPYRKGGADVAVLDGGTGSSATPTGINNLGHATLDHTGIPGVGGGIPAGTVIDFAGTVLPSGWLECDGASYATAAQPSLFAALSYTWGGAGANFNVPNLNRRATVGRGGSATGTLGNAVGDTGGAETHTLTTAELAIHAHGLNDGGHSHGENAPNLQGALNSIINTGGNAAIALGTTGTGTQSLLTNTNNNTTSMSIQNAGSGSAHNNMQPSAVVMKIIKT